MDIRSYFSRSSTTHATGVVELFEEDIDSVASVSIADDLSDDVDESVIIA